MKTPSASRPSDSSPHSAVALVRHRVSPHHNSHNWLATAALVLALNGTAPAQVPQLLNYQGRMAVGTPAVNFNGSGRFRFALVNAAGATSYWSNDGTSSGGSPPTAAVTLPVTKGLYSVLLGDITLDHMSAIPPDVWTHPDVRLRIWFDDGTANGSQLLSPDQRIAAVGYAMMADTVKDGAITSAQIAAGAITSAKIASGTVLPTQSVTDTALAAAANMAYTASNSSPTAFTLPSSATMGDVVQITGGAGSGGWTAKYYDPNGGWTAHETTRPWQAVASSADGVKLVAAINGGQLYTSVDSGLTWVPRDAVRRWQSVASSADGLKLVAAVYNGQIYTHPDEVVAASGSEGTAATLQYLGDGRWGAVGLSNGTVGSAQLAANAVQSGNIANGAVGNNQLAANAVRAGNIASGAVGSAQLATGSVDNTKLTLNAVTVRSGIGMSGGGTVALGDSLTLNNAGVLSLTGGGGVTVSGSNGDVTLGSTAQPANAANTIVSRDGSGDFATRSVALSGQLTLPATTSSEAGLVSLGGTPFLHAFGASNTFVGADAGNFTMSGGQNTALGCQALSANTTGASNTATGVFSLAANTEGFCNTGYGQWSLGFNTTGNYNTAHGASTLGSNTTGSYNVATGSLALHGNSTGNNNTAYGTSALGRNSTGTGNIALGYQAGYNLTTGNNNIDIGHSGVAGESNIIRIGNSQTDTYLAGTLHSGTLSPSGKLALPATTSSSVGLVSLGSTPFLHAYGSENTFVGINAGNFTMTGPANTATGYQALKTNTTGNWNTANGHEALFKNTTGFRNTATGNGAMLQNTIGGYNTATGCDALYSNTSGQFNTTAGCYALASNTTGSNNIALGYQAGTNLTTGSNNIDIGHSGVAGESAIIRIGNNQTDTYLAGVLHGNGSGLTHIPANAVTGTIPASQVATAPPGMVLIPAGVFTMGDSLDGIADAIPTVPVTLSAFYLAVNEVTVSQWQAVYYWAASHGYSITSSGLGNSVNHPVHTITWYDVLKWCNARSEMEGLAPCYYTDASQTTVYKSGDLDIENNWVKLSANGYRLPTEAEWEKAARGGLAGQRFPWGNTITQILANYVGQTGLPYDLGPDGDHPLGNNGTWPYTTPVGIFAANGYGLHDVAGNQFEWCWDWYGTPYAGGSNPLGPSSGSTRVMRGGNWLNIARHCRTADRADFYPSYADVDVGFRPARSLVP